MPKHCQDCRNWSQITTWVDHTGEGRKIGECRRHAPEAKTLPSGRLACCWPTTKHRDWCGDFKARETEAHSPGPSTLPQSESSKASNNHNPLDSWARVGIA